MTETITSFPPGLRKLVAARQKRHAGQLKEWATRNIEYHTSALRREAERLVAAEETAAKEVAEWGEAVARLRRAGFRVGTREWDLDLEVRTTQRRLPAVYKAVGRLDGATVEKEVEDGERGLVKVTLRSVRYPRLKVSFVRRVREGDACRIESHEVPARTEYRLVCER